jgi:hypothetical protein
MFSIVERFGIYLGGIILKACRYSLILLQVRGYFHSYPLSAATVTEIGRISDALMTRGGKSFVSYLVVGARLILIVHIN